MSKYVIALFAVASLSACFKHTYNAPGATPQSVASYDSWHHHFIWGLINASGSVNLESVCPQGVARIDNKMTFLNGLVTLFTGTLYQPTTVSVYCRANAQAIDVTIRPDREMVARWRAAYPNLERDLAAAVQAFEAEEAPQTASRDSSSF